MQNVNKNVNSKNQKVVMMFQPLVLFFYFPATLLLWIFSGGAPAIGDTRRLKQSGSGISSVFDRNVTRSRLELRVTQHEIKSGFVQVKVI